MLEESTPKGTDQYNNSSVKRRQKYSDRALMSTSPCLMNSARGLLHAKTSPSGLKMRVTPEKSPESTRNFQNRRLISNKSSQDIFLEKGPSSGQPFQTSRHSTKTRLELSPKFGDIASKYLVNNSTIGSGRKQRYRRMHSALTRKSQRQPSIVSNATSYASMVSGNVLKTRHRVSSITRTSRVTSSKSPGNVKRINQYTMMRTLGAGSYGKVKLCEDARTFRLFAMKII